ncbi:hypothetical protein [Mycobacterium sp. 1274761.0]|uniref:hypothetical protein n=1 Tax=Mycobacterium sp. 1274761.0 TaxID=1834077 RepID=UPI0007FE7524|nr:hypothetical protein [Mycobacterium sp. 1274761.0]OBK74001.1 hypothetical protein A5651_11900 [Mycobacterium sp. 1274761.0]
MAVPQLSANSPNFSFLDERIEWFDSDTGCTIVVSTPSVDPGLWAAFVDGAARSYHMHGIEVALDIHALTDEANTQLFYAVINDAGTIMGGIRAKGPLESPEDSHALVEWQDRPGLRTVNKMISDRLPFGVVEMKTAWMSDDPGRSRALSSTLARTPFTAMTLLDAQFVLATAGVHVLNRWRTSGGVVAAKVPATPYPDDRYRTKVMWWDRSTFTNDAEPKQLSKIFNELAIVSRRLDHVGARALGSGL